MSESLKFFRERVGGWPFIEESFKFNEFLHCLIAKRLIEIQKNLNVTPNPKYLLVPKFAQLAITRNKKNEEIIFREMTQYELKKCLSSIEEIKQIMPIWSNFFSIPIKFGVLLNFGVISCSSFSYPQSIFLDESVFLSKENLTEQLIHECCHIWTYMIEEIFLLVDFSNKGKFNLPSGARNKNLIELIGAIYVSKVLENWYLKKNNYERSSYLFNYRENMLDLIKSQSGITLIGYDLLSVAFKKSDGINVIY